MRYNSNDIGPNIHCFLSRAVRWIIHHSDDTKRSSNSSFEEAFLLGDSIMLIDIFYFPSEHFLLVDPRVFLVCFHSPVGVSQHLSEMSLSTDVGARVSYYACFNPCTLHQLRDWKPECTLNGTAGRWSRPCSDPYSCRGLTVTLDVGVPRASGMLVLGWVVHEPWIKNTRSDTRSYFGGNPLYTLGVELTTNLALTKEDVQCPRKSTRWSARITGSQFHIYVVVYRPCSRDLLIAWVMTYFRHNVPHSMQLIMRRRQSSGDVGNKYTIERASRGKHRGSFCRTK